MACLCLRDTLRGAQYASCDAAGAVVRLLFRVLGFLQSAAHSTAVLKCAAAVGKCFATIVNAQPQAVMGGAANVYLETASSNLQHPALCGPCMQFLAAVLSCEAYHSSPATPFERSEAFAVSSEQCVSAFFNQTRVAQICEYLITTRLMVQPSEIELWETDPEALVLGTGAVHHEGGCCLSIRSSVSFYRHAHSLLSIRCCFFSISHASFFLYHMLLPFSNCIPGPLLKGSGTS